MAVITLDTFDPLRRYVGVRLQQGVPIVDADENEREDVRQFELRAFLKWFVGNGVPEGNDGFRIEAAAAPNNNFIIRVGVAAAPAGLSNVEKGLRHVGRCLVDGLDAIIDADRNFTAQPLHPSQATAPVLSAAWGVPQIQAIPNGPGTVVAYLDVWNRLVTPTEDPSLVHPALGTESCARLRREWVVRVRNGTTVPISGNPDFIAGHSYYALATIVRRAGDPAINNTDITDKRERRLLIPPATLITDLFGTNPIDYRMGIGRPAVSLREAINALLRGEIPSTPDAPIAPAPGVDAIRRGFLFDQSNGVVAIWSSPRVGGTDQVFATRIDQDDIAAGFALPPQQVTNGIAHAEPYGALMPNGELIVTCRGGAVGPGSDIFYKRAALSQLAGAAEQIVTNAAGQQSTPSVLVSGNFAVFIFHNAVNNRLQYRRLNITNNTFADAAPIDLPAPANVQADYHAATDPAGNVWVAVRMGVDIRALRLNPTTGAVDQETTLDSSQGADNQPFVLPVSNTDVWVFLNSPNQIYQARNNGAAWQLVTLIPNTIASDDQPAAVRDAQGGIWLFVTRTPPAAATTDIYFMGFNPATGTWGLPKQMTTSAGNDTAPSPLMAANEAIWVFWASDRTGDTDIYFKRLVTAI